MVFRVLVRRLVGGQGKWGTVGTSIGENSGPRKPLFSEVVTDVAQELDSNSL